MIQRRPFIDWLRAAAVLSVMLYHGNGAREGLGVATGNGWVGVDLFFVLSGFLVTRSWFLKPDLSDYLKKRAQRVLPAFWACLLFGLGLGWLMGAPGRDVLTEAAYNLIFAGNQLPMAAKFPILLGPLWSLATEVQFWLLVPFLAPLVHRHAWVRPWRTLLLLLAIPVACRASVAFIPGMTAPWGWGEAPSLFGPIVYALPFTHMDGLLLGAFLAVAEDRLVEIPSRKLLPALLLGLVAMVAGAPFRTYLPRPLVMVLFQYTALALGFGAAVLMAWRTVGTNSAPNLVGWYSERIFSLYLAQGIVGMLLSPLVIQTMRMGTLGQLAVLGIFVALSTAVGAGLYALVERPFAKGLQRRRGVAHQTI